MCPGHADLAMPTELTLIPLAGQLGEPKWRLCLYLLASGSQWSTAHVPSNMRTSHFTEEQKQREAE